MRLRDTLASSVPIPTDRDTYNAFTTEIEMIRHIRYLSIVILWFLAVGLSAAEKASSALFTFEDGTSDQIAFSYQQNGTKLKLSAGDGKFSETLTLKHPIEYHNLSSGRLVFDHNLFRLESDKAPHYSFSTSGYASLLDLFTTLKHHANYQDDLEAGHAHEGSSQFKCKKCEAFSSLVKPGTPTVLGGKSTDPNS